MLSFKVSLGFFGARNLYTLKIILSMRSRKGQDSCKDRTSEFSPKMSNGNSPTNKSR